MAPSPRNAVASPANQPVRSHSNADASTSAGPARMRTSTRTSARRNSTSTTASNSAVAGPSTPQSIPSSTPAPLTPASSASTTSRLIAPRPVVEPKVHGLRHVLGERNRVSCPFPEKWGGRERCGVSEEDEKDEVLMATCAAIANLGNRALSPDEIANICYEESWLRQPTAAVSPANVINTAIRAHQKRCDTLETPRTYLLAKHQLAGSVNESVLEACLHPSAFDGRNRPKGTVWFLTTAGKTKWKSPLDGIEIPTAPPKKPVQSKKKAANKENKERVDRKKEEKNDKPKPLGSTMIRLVVGPVAQRERVTSKATSCEDRSRSRSRDTGTPAGFTQPLPLPLARRKLLKPHDEVETSSESDSSDSENGFDSAPSPSRIFKPRSTRNGPPALPIDNASCFFPPPLAHLTSRALPSPFSELFTNAFISTPMLPTFSNHSNTHIHSPFPSHSLDNTTWAARQDADRFTAFETSSSSSDDEAREQDWGMTSGILIKGEEGDDKSMWTLEDEEAKVKEATDALRVLFPMSSPEKELDIQSSFELNKLDNRPAPSETSSMAETSSTATAQAFLNGQLRSHEAAASVAFTAWTGNSSPIPSPLLRITQLPPDVSPTQHLSKLRSSFDPDAMDVDDEQYWLDDAGELPVKAEDTMSDIDLSSTVGDAATPEHDRHLHTAEWAREAAASTNFRVKEEQDDYPSPVTTEPDDRSALSRASSAESHSPSSRLSELPHFDIELETAPRRDLEEIIVGPESISVDDIDQFLPAIHRTPQRGRKARHQSTRCSGNWGSIGVGTPFSATFQVIPQAKTPSRQRSLRASVRRRRSSTYASQLKVEPLSLSPVVASHPLTPPTDTEVQPTSDSAIEIDDAIGTEDLERACAEAEAKEEEHRKACREKAETQRALLEAYRQKVREFQNVNTNEGLSSGSWDSSSAWCSDLASPTWHSGDSLSMKTPSAVSPMILHSVSSLSLGSDGHQMPRSVDPRALLSPPPGDGVSATAVAIEEMMSPAEVEEVLRSVSPIVQPDLIPTDSASMAFAPMASPGEILDLPMSPAAESLDSSFLGSTHIPAPVPASAISIAAENVPSISISETTDSSSIPAGNAVGVTSDGAADHAKPISPVSSASSSAGMGLSKTAVPQKGQAPLKFRRILMLGIDACVLDNIPVYSHIHEGKTGKIVILRRLDTDFVNASNLLLALNVPISRHGVYLNSPSPFQSTHRILTSTMDGKAYSVGVSGVWVHYNEALDYAKRLRLSETAVLANILRPDLFAVFAAVALLDPAHSIGKAFGLPFIAGCPPQSQAQSASNGAFANSSATSKSTPNLPALSSSAPAAIRPAPSVSTPKGPLVRSAPPTPPDGASQPKRRRATIVDELSSLSPTAAKVPIAPKKPVSASSKPSPAQRRATRASVGGDMPKPKASK